MIHELVRYIASKIVVLIATKNIVLIKTIIDSE